MNGHIEVRYRNYTYEIPLPDNDDNAYLAGEAVTALLRVIQASTEPEAQAEIPTASAAPTEQVAAPLRWCPAFSGVHACRLIEQHVDNHECKQCGFSWSTQ